MTAPTCPVLQAELRRQQAGTVERIPPEECPEEWTTGGEE